MCRAEIGIHHCIAGTSLLRYAQHSSWREDNRRQSNGELALQLPFSEMSALGCGLVCPAPE